MEPRVRAIPHTLWPEDVAHCFRVCGEIEQVSAAVHMALTCSLCMQSKLSGQRISHDYDGCDGGYILGAVRENGGQKRWMTKRLRAEAR
jgi:hypothetical protein